MEKPHPRKKKKSVSGENLEDHDHEELESQRVLLHQTLLNSMSGILASLIRVQASWLPTCLPTASSLAQLDSRNLLASGTCTHVAL